RQGPARRGLPVAPAGPRRLRLGTRTLRAMLFVALLALAPPATALADRAQGTALAKRYAPVVRLVADTDCGPGDPYVPISVDLLFDEPTVALRGPWQNAGVVKIGPTAEDLSRGLYQYHLDFPGSALDPGCDYLHWQRRPTRGATPAVYAHVATDYAHPGKLALPYWPDRGLTTFEHA